MGLIPVLDVMLGCYLRQPTLINSYSLPDSYPVASSLRFVNSSQLSMHPLRCCSWVLTCHTLACTSILQDFLKRHVLPHLQVACRLDLCTFVALTVRSRMLVSTEETLVVFLVSFRTYKDVIVVSYS